MSYELQILLTAFLAAWVSGYLAFAHWIFGIVWLVSVGTFLYMAIKLIWGFA